MSTLSPSKPSGGFSARLDRLTQKWLNKRLPRARSIRLEQRRLFIFPTAAGFMFMATLLLMLLTAINYQNNLTYGLTFWLAMLFIVAVHFTHGNLLHLTIAAVSAESVFAGQRAGFHLRLTAGGKRAGHYSVHLQWPEAEQLVDVLPGADTVVQMHLTTGERGWFQPPRLRIESTYPLGLLRCWSYADLDIRALVYPRPLAAPELSAASGGEGAVGFSDLSGIDDLAGFRPYRPGDAPRHIDWRSWARGQALQTRVFSAPTRENHWLDWQDFQGGPREQRLSWLTGLALGHHRRGDDYGLRLPDVEIPLGSGDRHLERVLRALALFGVTAGAGQER